MVHNDDLRVASFRARSDISINELGSNLSIVWLEMIAETGLVVYIGLNKFIVTFQNIPGVRGWLESKCHVLSS